MSEENPEEQEVEESEEQPEEDIVGYTEDLDELEPDMVERADTVLYAEGSEESLDDIDEEIDAEFENVKESSVEVSGETYLFDDFTADMNMSQIELLDQDVSAEDFYEDEELEEIADELSGYNGIGSGVPILGSVLEWLLGFKNDKEDLDLDLLEKKGYTNEAHEEYLDTEEAYSQVKSRVEEAGENVVLFGEENPVTSKLNEDYDSLEIVSKDRIEGYVEFAEDIEDEEESEDESAEEMFSPERLAEMAGAVGGVDALYDGMEDDLPEPAYNQMESMRPEVEEIYEEEYKEENDQTAEEASA